MAVPHPNATVPGLSGPRNVGGPHEVRAGAPLGGLMDTSLGARVEGKVERPQPSSALDMLGALKPSEEPEAN